MYKIAGGYHGYGRQSMIISEYNYSLYIVSGGGTTEITTTGEKLNTMRFGYDRWRVGTVAFVGPNVFVCFDDGKIFSFDSKTRDNLAFAIDLTEDPEEPKDPLDEEDCIDMVNEDMDF